LQPAAVANLTTELIMIVTVTFAFELDDLLDTLDLELVEEEDFEDEDEDIDFVYDQDGVVWFYDEDLDVWYYFDEDLNDWAEVDADGTVWYCDEEGELFYFDDESDDWVMCGYEDVASW
jgi:hypothetical protein